MDGVLESIDLLDRGQQALDRALVAGAKDLCEYFVEQTRYPSEFRGHRMAQARFYAMSADEDRRVSSRFGCKVFSVLKQYNLCIYLQAADVLRDRTGCGVCIQIERSFNPTNLEEP
jgi:hypothetical protein